MSTTATISPRFPVKQLQRYPGLVASDFEAWDSYLESKPTGFLGFDYDIRVTTRRPPAGADNPEMEQGIIDATLARRIDIIGFRSDSIWIIEAKFDL